MDTLPLAGAGIKDCMGRYVSSIQEFHNCAEGLLTSSLIHESLTIIFLSFSICRGTDIENSGPGLQMMSREGHVSPFTK